MPNLYRKQLPGIRLEYKFWLSDEAGNGILGDGKWRILKLIDQKGSLKAACDELGWTYRRTWGNLKKIEDFFGFPLLEKHRGGHERGSTGLTPEGRQLVKAFDRFHQIVDATIDNGFREFKNELTR